VLLGDFVVLDDELGEVLLDDELPGVLLEPELALPLMPDELLPDAPLAPEPDLLK